jgi:hypothetical protein
MHMPHTGNVEDMKAATVVRSTSLQLVLVSGDHDMELRESCACDFLAERACKGECACRVVMAQLSALLLVRADRAM